MIRSLALRALSVGQLAICAVLLLLGAVPALAQFDSAQISGTVRDSSGSVIPGVSISLTNAGTGRENRTLSNEVGFFVFPNVPVGIYTVSAELQGFKKFAKTGVQLSAAVNIRVDIALEVGAISESVVVQATTNEVVTDTAVIGRSVGSREISELPLSGRNASLAAQLTAGVTGGSISADYIRGTSVQSAGGFNINGGRSDEYVTTVDGALSVRVRTAGGFSMGAQNIDTVEEVQVLTTNYQAEYGRASAGILRVVTKSGTQEFHGKLFETHQNSALNANSWTRNVSPNPRISEKPSPLRYNSFGFAIGGPIYIPGRFNTDKRKLFFYWGEEWNRVRDQTLDQGTVPTAAMRQGDFSELLDPNNPFFRRTRIITDPVTKQPFPDNKIQANRISPNGLALMNVNPLPTPGFQLGTDNYIRDFRRWDNGRKDSIKVDYAVTDRHRLAVRHTWFPHVWNEINGPVRTFQTIWDYPNRTAVVSLTSSFTATFMNEFTFSYGSTAPARFYGERNCEGCPSGDVDYPTRSTSGLTYPQLFPGTKMDPEKLPNFSIQGFTGGGGALNAYPGYWNDFVYIWGDNMTKTFRNHTLKWGFTIERSGMNDQIQVSFASAPATNNQNGSIRFFDSGNPNTTGLAIANVLLGNFDDYTEFSAKPKTPYVATAFDAFFQDTWKVTRSLTLEAGMRYSLWPPWGTRDNTLAMFRADFYDPAKAAVVDRTRGFIVGGDRFNGVVVPGCEPTAEATKKFPFLASGEFDKLYHCLPGGFSETRKNGFQPRMGLAYALNQKTAIRAGAGMFLNRVQINTTGPLGGNPPFMEQQTVVNGIIDNPGGAERRDFPFTMNMQDPVLKIPTAWAWNVTVERQLPGTVKMQVGYVGRRAYHNERVRNINQLLPGTLRANPGVNVNFLRPYTGMGVIDLYENSGTSRYNSLQVQVERRVGTGLGFTMSYTLSRNRDNGSGRQGGDKLPNAYDDSGYYGISNLDRTHVLLIQYYYSLPSLSSMPSAARYVFGNWGISGIGQFQSGAPFSVTTGEDIASVGAGSGAQFYRVVGDPNDVQRTDFTTSAVWFNKNAFARPDAGTFAPFERNILRNPGFWDLHLAIRRSFPIREGHRFDLRWEIFSFLNHPNLGAASSNPVSGSFGTITSKTGNRSMQVNLQYIF